MSITVKNITIHGKATFVDGKFSDFIKTSIRKPQVVPNSEEFGVGTKVIYARPIHGYMGSPIWRVVRPELVGKPGTVTSISVDGLVAVEYDDGMDTFNALADKFELATAAHIAAAEKQYEAIKKTCKRINERKEARNKKRIAEPIAEPKETRDKKRKRAAH